MYFFEEDFKKNKIIIKEKIEDDIRERKREDKENQDMIEYYKDLKRDEKYEFFAQQSSTYRPEKRSIAITSIEKVIEDPYFFFCTDEDELVYISSHPIKIKKENKKIVTHTDARASHLRYKEWSWNNKYEIKIKKWIIEKITPMLYEEVETKVFDVDSFLEEWRKRENKRTKNKWWMWDISKLMREEQDKIMRAPINWINLITWVAGSWKTNILLHRIQYLLREYPEKFRENKILFLCYNVWLQKYIHKMIKSNFWNVNIQTIDKRQKDIFVEHTKNQKHYTINFDYNLSEHEIDNIEKAWQEIIEKIDSIEDFIVSKEVARQKIHNNGTTASISIEFNIAKLIEKFIEPWTTVTKYHVYIWLYIFSLLKINQKEQQKDITVNIWNRKFNYKHSNTNFSTVIYKLNKPEYDHIFIDEVQDLLPIQIKILNWFHNNSMTIAWDETQLLSQNKSEKIDDVLWIKIDNKYSLETSHRVSQQIAVFANQILEDVKIKNEIKKVWFSGLKPILRRWIDLSDSYKYLAIKIKKLLLHEPKASICIALPGNNKLEELQKYLINEWINCYIAKGSKRDFTKNIHLTTYYQAKWLEFEYVFILWIKEFYTWNLENKNNVLYTLVTRAIKRLYIPIEWELPNVLSKINQDYYELQ